MDQINLWTLIINQFLKLANDIVVDKLPVHQSIGLVQMVMQIAGSTLGLTFTLVFSAFDMRIPYTIFGLIVTLEICRNIYVTYRLIKGVIPVIG